jgi:protein phosphatase
MSGKNNEDNYAVSAHQLSKTDSTPSILAVLADGVGGHMAGEVASKIATETISQVVLDSDGSNPGEILNFAIIQAGKKVAEQSDSVDVQQGMGSTCACVWVMDDRVYTASVGDSRIYFIRDGVIQQVTTDHTWVQEAIEHGILEPDQARNHPRAHVIRRYLGSKRPVEPDFRLRLNPDESDQKALANQGMNLLPGDRFLLCSDGLTDLVSDNEILGILQNEKMDRAVQSLADLANARGGHDNITIVILKNPQSEDSEKPTTLMGIELTWQIYLAISLIVIVAAVLSTVLFLYVSRTPAIPSPTPTVEPLEMIQPTETVTVGSTPTTIPTLTPTGTPKLETYTPWPTHTYTPEL